MAKSVFEEGRAAPANGYGGGDGLLDSPGFFKVRSNSVEKKDTNCYFHHRNFYEKS